MITKTERKKLMRLLKPRYSSDVISILTKKRINNNEGKPFSKGYISNVLNGRETHIEVETAIFELYEKRKKLQSKMKTFKENILQK